MAALRAMASSIEQPEIAATNWSLIGDGDTHHGSAGVNMRRQSDRIGFSIGLKSINSVSDRVDRGG
jgi:hypothetical protein